MSVHDEIYIYLVYDRPWSPQHHLHEKRYAEIKREMDQKFINDLRSRGFDTGGAERRLKDIQLREHQDIEYSEVIAQRRAKLLTAEDQAFYRRDSRFVKMIRREAESMILDLISAGVISARK
jgi:hypothetical protein